MLQEHVAATERGDPGKVAAARPALPHSAAGDPGRGDGGAALALRGAGTGSSSSTRGVGRH